MVAEKKSKRVIFTPCPPRMERGTIVICIFSIFSIFVQDVHVPYYNHAAGSQASMTIGKPLALISLSRTRGSICGNTNAGHAVFHVRCSVLFVSAPTGHAVFHVISSPQLQQLYLDHLLGKTSQHSTFIVALPLILTFFVTLYLRLFHQAHS